MKNKAFFESLQSEMRTLIAGINPKASNPSFASVASRAAMGPPPPPGPPQDRGRLGRDLDHVRVQGQGFNRERSSSASKRARVDDEADVHRQEHGRGGGPHAGGQLNADQGRPQNRSQSRTRKYVVGTLSTNQRQDRKMKSPPADVFIYGVHPDTTEDIVNDLKESDIIIEAKDIIKKSKPEAALNSYKISVKAEDLQRALDPSIWPLRVKVREYIYYSRRTPRNQEQGHGQGLQGAAGGQQQVDGKHRHRAADHTVWNGVPTYSRFDAFNSAGGSSDQP